MLELRLLFGLHTVTRSKKTFSWEYSNVTSLPLKIWARGRGDGEEETGTGRRKGERQCGMGRGRDTFGNGGGLKEDWKGNGGGMGASQFSFRQVFRFQQRLSISVWGKE